jgi:hypothetical protein
MKHPKSLKVVFAALAVSMVPLFGSCDSGADSAEPAQEFTTAELTNILSNCNGTWTLPEIPNPNWFHVQLWKDGEYFTGSSMSGAESLRDEKEMPFSVRLYRDEEDLIFEVKGGGGGAGFDLGNFCGQNYSIIGGEFTYEPGGVITVGTDGVVVKFKTKEEDGAHEITIRLALTEDKGR